MLAGIVPSNSIRRAKTRLGVSLSYPTKARFLLTMLRTVLQSALDSDLDATYFVSSDQALMREAASLGALPVPERRPMGADGAVALGNSRALKEGATATLVLFSDLPMVTKEDVNEMISMSRGMSTCVVATPSTRGGTNALLRCPPEVIRTRYGENSFINHGEECRKARVPFFEFRSDRISLDMDTREDLELLLRRRDSSQYSFLSEYM